MPLHVAPPLRFREEVEESSGIYKTLDSVLVAEFKTEETAGTRVKVLPKGTINYLGTLYTPS